MFDFNATTTQYTIFIWETSCSVTNIKVKGKDVRPTVSLSGLGVPASSEVSLANQVKSIDVIAVQIGYLF